MTSYRILLVSAVTAFFLSLCHPGICKDGAVKQISDIKHILERAEYLSEEEQLRIISVLKKQLDTVNEVPFQEECQLSENIQTDVRNNDDFQDMVQADVTKWDRCLGKWWALSAYAEWDYETNINEKNEKKVADVDFALSSWKDILSKNAQLYLKNEKFKDLSPDLQRKVRLMTFNTAPKDPNNKIHLREVQSKLQEIYSTATVEGLYLEPDLTKIIAESRDPNILLVAWWGWRNATGPVMKPKYAEMVRLLDIGAKDNGFSNYADAWIELQFDETRDMESVAERLWQEILPLYEQLHAYVRTRLADVYTDDLNSKLFNSGAIPAHLTGNMWAQDWQNIYELIKPYKEIVEPNYNEMMKRQNYTVDTLFNMAEDFYTSIGLYPMTPKFNKYSMKVRPSDGRKVVCHASAHDFFSVKPDNDFRIKMCTEINMEYFETCHHEMGHIEYFMAYQNQPSIYRDGANSAFHEAIGDTISLSVMTRQHMKTVGLDKNSARSRGDEHKVYKQNINFLMQRALFKIAFLPFAYMIDKWRWNVFRGYVLESEYNKHWWDLRLKYQGIVSPVPRNEEQFDPGAKFHIPSNSPYICYFVSFIVQFQFYKAMCDANGYQGPLYNCDFYRSKLAGNKLKSMLTLGKSKPWKEAMKVLTGVGEVNTAAILEYFQPLQQWLEQENKRTNTTIGWRNAKVNWKSSWSYRHTKA